MEVMNLQIPANVQLVGITNINAPMDTAFLNHSFAMAMMTVAIIATKETALPQLQQHRLEIENFKIWKTIE